MQGATSSHSPGARSYRDKIESQIHVEVLTDLLNLGKLDEDPTEQRWPSLRCGCGRSTSRRSQKLQSQHGTLWHDKACAIYQPAQEHDFARGTGPLCKKTSAEARRPEPRHSAVRRREARICRVQLVLVILVVLPRGLQVTRLRNSSLLLGTTLAEHFDCLRFPSTSIVHT